MSRERNNDHKKNENTNLPRAKKSLGQHFLTDTRILDKIVDVGNIFKGDLVLEIGPGRGALTRALLARGARVLAIEKDEALVAFLRDEFATEIKTHELIVLSGDVLDSSEVLMLYLAENVRNPTTNTYKVVANIPYYITGKILRFLFSLEIHPAVIVLLVQEEVAARVAVQDGKKESILSLSIKAFGTPRYRGEVKAEAFSPPPKVDSAILSIENISRKFFDVITEEKFFKIIKQAFSQKRKTILNTLFADDKVRGTAILEKVGLSKVTRPEEISLEKWKELISLL